MAYSLPEQLRLLSEPEKIGGETFSFGIEEEYFLVDARTGQAAAHTPECLFAQISAASDGRIGHEFLQAQAEADTYPCATQRRGRDELRFVRTLLRESAAEYGLAPLACGTHPTALWDGSAQTVKHRYDRVMGELQMIGRRNMFCGMHVHVELPDPDRRVEVMERLVPYLPLFLALSASSPFWQSHLTGLKSYRFAAYDELPRSGFPPMFRTKREFDDYVAALVRAEAIPDGTYIWWAVRPSMRFPTLELRTPDCCTRLDDAMALVGLYRALLRHLFFHPGRGSRVDTLARALAQENKWRAERYGIHCTFVTKSEPIGVGEFLEEVIAMTAEDADMLGCAEDIARCRAIIAEGTSADAQIRVFREHVAHGTEAALARVVAWIAETTAQPGTQAH
ncbi:MAG TPA: carboxylate-amine ligase [Magnetospirillum sp.]|jgi:carboxylate-amine ligase|nr:carboxylate-amine ligase [Magnetospirillum sp.]